MPKFQNLFVNKSDVSEHGIVICGHRGGMGKNEPENTMRAFKKAKEHGLQMIEFDVSASICTFDKYFIEFRSG